MSATTQHPWRDEERIRELYWDQGKCAGEVADELGCTERTIWTWIKKHGMETRRNGHPRKERVNFDTSPNGYERWKATHPPDRGSVVMVHRLLAVSEHGFDAVAEKHVHHVNGVKWDNRPENIEVMTHEEHNRLHAIERDFGGLVDGKSPWEIHNERAEKSMDDNETAAANMEENHAE